jgi:hypothetical protein
MNTPAVTVPPDVIPHNFVPDDVANPASGTTPGPGTGAPELVDADVPAPTYRGTVPAFVITTDDGPGGIAARTTADPATLTPYGSITSHQQPD